MAAERHNPSRPAGLGADWSTPAISNAAPLMECANVRRGALARAALRRLEAAMKAHRIDHLEPAERACLAARDIHEQARTVTALNAAFAGLELLETRFDRLASWYVRAILRALSDAESG